MRVVVRCELLWACVASSTRAKVEPAVPVCGTIDLEFLSRERDTHEPVIPAIYCTGQTGVLKKIPTVIDRAWDQDFSLGGLSCPHEMNRHARSHGFNWKRLFPTMQTCLICKSKLKILFVKQGVVIRQNLMS